MFTLPELQVIRMSLDHITIKGSDAKLLAELQIKVEQELLLFQQMDGDIESPTTKSNKK